MLVLNEVSLIAAFLAGLLSFISPCVLPLVPGYISFISGISLEDIENKKKQNRNTVIIGSIFFILGFSLIFILLGATATLLGNFLLDKVFVFKKIAELIANVDPSIPTTLLAFFPSYKLNEPIYRSPRKEEIAESYLTMKNHGLTIKQYNEILHKQGDVCAICRRESSKNLHVDHNHKTGRIRGLLCYRCNSAIGYLQDNVDRAKQLLKYLEDDYATHKE